MRVVGFRAGIGILGDFLTADRAEFRTILQVARPQTRGLWHPPEGQTMPVSRSAETGSRASKSGPVNVENGPKFRVRRDPFLGWPRK